MRVTESETQLVSAIFAGDAPRVASELADDVAFNSPIRRYTKRAEAVHLLALVGAILPGARVERTWSDERGAATVISATVDGARLDGVLEELHDEDGRVREVSLLLRPHAAMMAAVKRMATALEGHPLPT